MEVAGEMQVDTFHGQHLCVAATGCTALHAEAGTERRFAQGHAGFFAQCVQAQCQTNAHGGFANAGTSSRDGCNENQFAFLILVDERKGQFGNVLTVVLNVVGIDTKGLSHFVNAFQRGAVGYFNVFFHYTYQFFVLVLLVFH